MIEQVLSVNSLWVQTLKERYIVGVGVWELRQKWNKNKKNEIWSCSGVIIAPKLFLYNTTPLCKLLSDLHFSQMALGCVPGVFFFSEKM